MVLRKRAPPRLQSLGQAYEPTGPRSLSSKASPTSKSLSSSSPKRLTRPRRAQSTPQPQRAASPDSIFYPDLNTSPAFDLMPLEQAQRSPTRASPGDATNAWADELVERFNLGLHESTGPAQSAFTEPIGNGAQAVDGNGAARVPTVLTPAAHGRPYTDEWQQPQHRGAGNGAEWDPHSAQHSSMPLQSNNPFLKPRAPSGLNPWEDPQSRASYGAASSISQDGASVRLGQDEGYIPMTARLSLLEQPEEASPWADEHTTTATQPISYTQAQPAQQLHEPDRLSPDQSMSTPVSLEMNATGSSHVLIDLNEAPRAQFEGSSKLSPTEYGIMSDTQGSSQPQKRLSGPPLPERPKTTSEPGAEVQARSASTAPLSEAEIQRQQEQRAETYSIRHVHWANTAGSLCDSPVLIQNKNGPCPLLALVNALVLRAAGQEVQPPIVRALQTREQISLGLLIEALFDELTTCLGPDDELPDIEALTRFLTMLHTGMNVNPRLTLESENSLGSFLQTDVIRLYSTFGVPLVHGWVAAPSTEVHAALDRVAHFYEDIQLLPFRKQELEDRVIQGGSLTPQEEQTMQDIHTIHGFTDVENATQLSPFGLDQLLAKLKPGSLSILFRNDHFTTLYKHPQLSRLFTLVTDAGYASHAEIVWESLVDVNGSSTSYYAGDFRPVSHDAPRASDPSGPRASSNTRNSLPTPPDRHSANLSPQEQADADYAYALSLQYQEEEQRASTASNDRTPPHRASMSNASTGVSRESAYGHNRSSSGVNVNSTGNGDSYATAARNQLSRQSQGSGRRSQTRFSTHRPVHGDEVPPPSYEQAASSPAIPSPPRTAPNSADSSLPSPTPYQRNTVGRRPYGNSISGGSGERSKERNKDCVVM
ncbi:uncharacterized protein BO97DRAFT_471181 [Aspergillus homomorphus CBS 101889]|uniref:MINDY deubiquitinase domain-containing protein n=1 Tax=Aspergillus homomorphus (strain CBS 101889) TaxID=1450537 RepID=A0A395HT59_ASPHC|nr:hypothetical protein BO97DRAFT_471181 [Aspergillus homomorphus CBS 101889]RAL11142.1 hypothetical protein BO97DRAFT_471181 [Aspergillus homomorphus CBS 101889]